MKVDRLGFKYIIGIILRIIITITGDCCRGSSWRSRFVSGMDSHCIRFLAGERGSREGHCGTWVL